MAMDWEDFRRWKKNNPVKKNESITVEDILAGGYYKHDYPWFEFIEKSEVDLRAKLLIHLVENKLIKLEGINGTNIAR